MDEAGYGMWDEDEYRRNRNVNCCTMQAENVIEAHEGSLRRFRFVSGVAVKVGECSVVPGGVPREVLSELLLEAHAIII